MVGTIKIETDNSGVNSKTYHIKSQLYGVFAEHGFLRSYNKKCSVFLQNDSGDEAYVVERGRIKNYTLTQDGKEITFSIVNPGEMVGFAEAVLNCPRMRNAETMSDTLLWVMKRDKLVEILSSDPDLCFKLLYISTNRVLNYQTYFEEIVTLPVRDRVINLIKRLYLENSRERKDSYYLDFPITHEEIAQMVGSSRQTVTLVINELRKEGIISWEEKKLKVIV